MKRILLIILPMLLVTISCTTISDRQTAEAALNVSVHLNNGETDALSGQSGTPFLFEDFLEVI